MQHLMLIDVCSLSVAIPDFMRRQNRNGRRQKLTKVVQPGRGAILVLLISDTREARARTGSVLCSIVSEEPVTVGEGTGQ